VVDVLVTGGAGFIGSNLVRSLLASGHRVRVLDDCSTGSLGNLRGLDGPASFIRGDIRDREAVERAAAGVEIVYHLAAIPSVARSVTDPVTSHEVNANGTLNVLLAARDAGVRRVIYASSSSVYGDTARLPKSEDMPVAPLSPYAASKLAGEGYCRAFARAYGMETISLRFFNVFGPRQNPASQYASAIPRFLTRMLAGEPPIVFGDGRQSRDFTFVSNVVQACLLAASAGTPLTGEAANVGCGERTSILNLIAILNELLGTELQPVFTEPRPGDVRDSQASTSLAARLFGYQPLTTLRDGLADTLSWFAVRESTPVTVA
jgi:UDP-glucose 4-epimerase